MLSAARVAARRLAKTLARNGKRYDTHFYGMDDGDWMATEDVLMGADRREWNWEMIASLASRNEWRNFSVEGATEHNTGFRKALPQIVKEFPEVLDFWASFDGPYKEIRALLGVSDAPGVQWGSITFLHGTTTAVLERILREGIRPRGETNVDPTFGSLVNARPGNEAAVYLTTQQGMAAFAARDASVKKGGQPLILEIKGIDGRVAGPDEDDKRAVFAEDSLAHMGSIAYFGTVKPQMIVGAMVFTKAGRWETAEPQSLIRMAAVLGR